MPVLMIKNNFRIVFIMTISLIGHYESLKALDNLESPLDLLNSSNLWRHTIEDELQNFEQTENKRKSLQILSDNLNTDLKKIQLELSTRIEALKRHKTKTNRLWKHWFHQTIRKKNGEKLRRSEKIAGIDNEIAEIEDIGNDLKTNYIDAKAIIDQQVSLLQSNESNFNKHVEEENKALIKSLDGELELFMESINIFLDNFDPNTEAELQNEVIFWQEKIDKFRSEQYHQLETLEQHMLTNESSNVFELQIDLDFYRETSRKSISFLKDNLKKNHGTIDDIETKLNNLLDTWHDRFTLLSNHQELDRFIYQRTPFIARALPVFWAIGGISSKFTWTFGKNDGGSCPICEEPANIFLDCQHSLCISCGKNWWSEKIAANQFPLKCFDVNCNHELNERELEQLNLDESSVWLSKKRKFEARISSLEENLYIPCDTPDCPGIIYAWKNKKHQCVYCSKDYCFQCNAFHEECQKTREDKLSEEYLKTSMEAGEIKTCPKCKAPTYRIDGCNHITCPCGYHWHWRDGNHWQGYRNQFGQDRDFDYIYGR